MKNLAFITAPIMSMLLLLFLSCSDEVSIYTQDSMKKALQNLSGTYQDETSYPYGTAFGKRVFTFEEGKWTLEFTLALDPELKMQVFQFRTLGTYKVKEKSPIVKNAYNALFKEEKKYLTLKTDNPELIQAFGFVSCNLTKDVEKDISEEGCSLWASVSECSEDHDLLSLDATGKLYFGVRPPDNNMCTADRRPSELTPPVIKL